MHIQEVIQQDIIHARPFTLSHIDSLGLTWTAQSRGEFDLAISVNSPEQGQIAHLVLEVNPDEDTMSSQDTWVDSQWRRLGLSTRMYDWAGELGNTITASDRLSDYGKKFWKARKK